MHYRCDASNARTALPADRCTNEITHVLLGTKCRNAIIFDNP